MPCWHPRGQGTGTRAAPCQHPPSFQRRAREHTGGREQLQLTAPRCVQTRLGSSLQLQVAHGLACREFGQVSALVPHGGTAVNRQAAASAWRRSSRAPRRTPGCPALRSRTLQHCGPAGFSRDASKRRNQISREGSSTFLAAQRSCRGNARNWGSCWAPQPGQRKPRQTPSRPCAVRRCPRLQELLLLYRPLFAEPPCPGTSHQLCFTPSDIKQWAWRAGTGEGPCWGTREGLAGGKLSKENRRAACGEGVPSTQGRYFWSGLV